MDATHKTLRILVIEDVAADAELIERELRKAGLSFQITRVESERALRRALSPAPDLILSDHGLPGLTGFAALEIAGEACPQVPFIFVTGSLGEEGAVRTMKSGAIDIVLKNRLESLGPAVLRALEHAEAQQRQRAAEQALRESEEALRMLAEGIKDHAIMMLDLQGCVSNWNTGAEGIFGYRHDRILGQPFAVFLAPTDRQAARWEELLAATGQLGRREDEFQCVREDGNTFWAFVAVTALRDDRGMLRGYAAITRDITERRRWDEKRNQLAAIVDSANDAILSKTLAGIILTWNPGAERLFGYKASEIVGRPITVLIPPDRLEEETMILDRIRSGKRVQSYESIRMRKDGSRVAVSLTISPIKDDRGHIVGASKIATDISGRKIAEENLRRSEARHTAILNAALDAIISMDSEGVIHEWNPGAARLFSYERSEAVGRKLDDLIIPSSLLRAYRDGLARYLVTGAGSLLGREIELQARRSDGTEFVAELSITHIPDSQPPLYTSVIRDITDRKKSEAEVQRLNSRLEQRVVERTAELESVNKDLEAFSYSISHDLRAPLRHIQGFTEILGEQAAPRLNSEDKELLQRIERASQRMGRLIEDLLAFSQLGFTELRKTPVSLDEIVRGVLDDLDPAVRERARWDIGTLPVVEADRTLLQQVMANLISNALKYSRGRKVPRIGVAATETHSGVVVNVSDNGVGFDMQYVGKLFSVFQRLHRDADFEGTGIGLANVRRIVERHGGRAWANGKVDGGATFSFFLPAAGMQSGSTP